MKKIAEQVYKPSSVAEFNPPVVIYLVLPLLVTSCSLPFPIPTYNGRNEQLLNRDLFGLAPRRDCPFHPFAKGERLVSVALVLTLRWTAVSRYAALWSSDFPPPLL